MSSLGPEDAFARLRRTCAELGPHVSFPASVAGQPMVGSTDFETWDVRDGGEVLSAGDMSVKRKPTASVFGPGAQLVIGPNVSVDGTRFHVRGRNCAIYIGEGCKLRHVVFEAKGRDCFIAIGPGTTWETGGCIASGTALQIIIGDDGLISNNVMVRTEDGHGIFDRDSKEIVNAGASVLIERHVWIGNGAKVNKGTHIGTGTVLGGSSIATKTLDANCIYAGAPAAKVRSNIAWSRTYSYEAIPDEYR